MQRDQKVGLALGVLLIGVVGAFFFRNEPDASQRVPALQSAEEVDREIAAKRLTPYLPEKREDDPSGKELLRKSSSSRTSEVSRGGERPLPRWDEWKAEQVDPFDGRTADAVPVPAPDPIPLASAPVASAEARGASATLPESPPRSEGGISGGGLAEAAPPDDVRPAGERIHEVQKGETLSSIAGKYLGSAARYQEIFAANQDQLHDANDLRIGQKLRIPAGP